MQDSGPQLEIIGWHDGITEAFIHSGDNWKYASLIAWDVMRELRVFGIVATSEAVMSGVRSLRSTADTGRASRSDSWRQIRLRISEFLNTVAGSAEIRLCTQLDAETWRSLEMDAALIVPLMGGDIEDAVDAQRVEEWLSHFFEISTEDS